MRRPGSDYTGPTLGDMEKLDPEIRITITSICGLSAV